MMNPDPGAGGISGAQTSVCHESSKEESTMTIAIERQARYLPATRLNQCALFAGGGAV
jgi:hypothetical protein